MTPDYSAVSSRLFSHYPVLKCALNFRNAYELLVASRLSAQCTDKRVNIVCEELFRRWPDPQSLADAKLSEVESVVRPCGLYHMKSRDIVAMAKEYELAIINHTRSSHDSHDDYTAQMMIDRILAEKDELGRGLNGAILLFHDKYPKTVEAMKVILPALQQQGYQLVTVSELLNCSNEGLHWGWIYSKAD